jgi:hypothetical protein
MKVIVIIVAALVLSSCAQMGPTAEQLQAMVGTSSSLCVMSPGWNGSSVQVHYASFGGKSTGTGGGGGEATCGTSTAKFNNEGKATTPATVTTTTTTKAP